jgi:predicted metal-dependent phosphoesterase TrpH
VRIDLHVHSDASDGTDSPAEVMRRAAAAGLDVIALTDHDTTAGWDEARNALPGGLTLVPGMELSCLLDGRSVHLLAYLFDPGNEELGEQTSLIRDDRVHRARQMVAKLGDLGAAVTWEQVTRIAASSGGTTPPNPPGGKAARDFVVGRPHIARALAEAGVVESPADAFTKEWIDDGGRAYVERYALPVDRAIRLVRAAGGVPVLAHPRSPGYEVSDEAIAGLAAVGLAGVEVFHPDHDSSERISLTALARTLSLVSTGGSDDHGSFTPSAAAESGAGGIGSETTPEDQYELLIAEAAPAMRDV